MSILRNGNWGLRLLALVLAVIIYHTLKDESAKGADNGHDRSIFQRR